MDSNRTIRILDAAKRGGYAVGAYNWYGSPAHRSIEKRLTDDRSYNDDGVMAVVHAAEAQQAPAIIQLFPWTMHFQGTHFVRWVVNYAHAAKVPIAVHLDHCIEPADIEAALDLPLDSVMVDASRLDPEANIAECARIVERAATKGIAIEAEMGRIEGGEDGLPNVDMDTVLTDPAFAKDFTKRTGVHFLAPSFGNIHGSYGPGGPERVWRLNSYVITCSAVQPFPEMG